MRKDSYLRSGGIGAVWVRGAACDRRAPSGCGGAAEGPRSPLPSWGAGAAGDGSRGPQEFDPAPV